ncbi:hypothetical protein OH76DRAFT_946068 [Lentinus brumalis]|uniref:Uncharacterized protein n=1 Tax=Lentinus brumalis TaxID=2498619 RepID=A0A371CZ56_9APHY|nr:hypothetical protein OH76DRAFT_946068 [Polyporus brumalis]
MDKDNCSPAGTIVQFSSLRQLVLVSPFVHLPIYFAGAPQGFMMQRVRRFPPLVTRARRGTDNLHSVCRSLESSRSPRPSRTCWSLCAAPGRDGL